MVETGLVETAMAPPMITAADAAKAQERITLERLRVQAALSDEQILAAYCEAQRARARADIKMILEGRAAEQDIEDYIKKHGTEEG